MEAHYHFQARCKDGALIHVEVHGVRTEYNGRPALLGTVLDITERKRAESALSELSARLLQLQDEERRRLARELHDTTAQELAALTMNISLLQRYEPGQNEKFQRLLGDSLALAEKATQEIRTLSYLLHPPELDAVGLAAAVREYAAGLARRSGLRVDVSLPPELERLPRETELVFFRVVQESLANVLRHSRSETAIIEFTRNENEITLEVRDQGRGLPAEKLSSANEPGGLGVGIAGMRERLRQLGGKLEIISGTGGTTVRAIAPLAEKPRAVAA
jgi:signal transduction histidine kinase